MTEKQFYASTNQVVAILLDVFGILFVLVGASIARAHSGEGVGLIIYWVGFVLLIVSLILFVWSMRKPNMTKT
jgi:drug/metabolite transporter (DMT)-like permease